MTVCCAIHTLTLISGQRTIEYLVLITVFDTNSNARNAWVCFLAPSAPRHAFGL
jgi:hypothetical protein